MNFEKINQEPSEEAKKEPSEEAFERFNPSDLVNYDESINCLKEISSEIDNQIQVEQSNEPIEEREKIWKEKLEELDGVGDRKGLGIDKGIMETVAALQLSDFSTSQSCEGHIDSGYQAPWVNVEAPNEPEEKYIGQRQLFQEIANKFNISIEEAEHNSEIRCKVDRDCFENGKTEEYRKWEEENNKLRLKMVDLLDEFYKERKVSDNKRLIAEPGIDMSFRLHNGGDDYDRKEKEIKEGIKFENDPDLKDRLISYQEEMRDFTDFLKQKFLNS